MLYTLKGLNCANCAEKIKNEIVGLDYVENANINMITQVLDIELSETIPADMDKQVTFIVHKYEPDVEVIKDNSGAGELKDDSSTYCVADFLKSNSKKMLVCAILLFAVSFLVNDQKSETILNVIAYILAGAPVIRVAIINLLSGKPLEENFLMMIATIGAWFTNNHHEAVGVMIFYGVGEWIQDLAVDNSRASISKLLEIAPDYANLVIGSRVEKVDPNYVNIGDTIIIKPFEKIPLDAEVLKGRSSVDTSAITGESNLVDVEPGSKIYSGAINQGGLISAKVSANFKNSTVSKILDLVENAANKKAKTERFVTRFAKVYTPVVVFTAAIMAILVPFILGQDFYEWFYRAMVFLVISCPCALVLSIPLGYFSGIGVASKKGILIKGGSDIDTLINVDAILFDKTGTLTSGELSISHIDTFSGYDEKTVLQIASEAEKHSSHPIAAAIRRNSYEIVDLAEGHQEVPGRGIECIYKNKKVNIGNRKYFDDLKIKIQSSSSNNIEVLLGIDGVHIATLYFTDKIKDNACYAIKELYNQVDRLVLISGDKSPSVQQVAEKLNINEYYAELLPHQKLEKLEIIKSEIKNKIAFVGDGVNDAPVLAGADIGIAMGGLGSDVAIEASDIVIMNDDLTKIVDAIHISQRTNLIIKENVVFILAVKAIVLLLGAMGYANMWSAIFADVGVAVISILNSARLLKIN